MKGSIRVILVPSDDHCLADAEAVLALAEHDFVWISIARFVEHDMELVGVTLVLAVVDGAAAALDGGNPARFVWLGPVVVLFAADAQNDEGAEQRTQREAQRQATRPRRAAASLLPAQKECSGPGNVPPFTSAAYALAPSRSTPWTSAYCLTNFAILPLRRPNASCQTST